MLATACTTEPSPLTGFSGAYALSIDASSSCAAALPVSQFSWTVQARSGAGSMSTLDLPAMADPNGLDGLMIRLRATDTSLTGSFEGGARVDRSLAGGYRVRLYDAGNAPAPLTGSIRTTHAERVVLAVGTFSGTVNVGLYQSSAGGSCLAADHAWTLTAQ